MQFIRTIHQDIVHLIHYIIKDIADLRCLLLKILRCRRNGKKQPNIAVPFRGAMKIVSTQDILARFI